jgi:hypothetical protein
MSLLLGALRASPRTADDQKNGAPDQEDSHHSYEVSLANYYGALTFSMHVSSATSTSKHATRRPLAHLSENHIHRSAWKGDSPKFALRSVRWHHACGGRSWPAREASREEGREASMDFNEKVLYHQIHPAKLAADVSGSLELIS